MRSFLRHARVRRSLGFAVAFLGLLAVGELYLRCFPPREFQTYLGDSSPLTGPFESDPAFGVRYRDWQTFVNDYRDALTPHLPFPNPDSSMKLWAMFGNSFVQAPGMLADTARQELPDRRVFNLGRNELLFVRLSQIELLLENGLKPDRVFVAILPLDLWAFYLHSLAQTEANERGAITYRVRDPGGLAGWCVANSRLALTAWIRAKRHHAHPGFNPSRLPQGLSDDVLNDVRHLFANLQRVSAKHDVPVTVILIPNYEQIVKGASFGLQDQLAELFTSTGLDVCDTRNAFVNDTDKATLFIPDKHFSPRGNHLLLRAVLDHLDRKPRTEEARR
jgi:hypothetical protein